MKQEPVPVRTIVRERNSPIPASVGPFTDADVRKDIVRLKTLALKESTARRLQSTHQIGDSEHVHRWRNQMLRDAEDCAAIEESLDRVLEHPEKWGPARVLAEISQHYPRMSSYLGWQTRGPGTLLCRAYDTDIDYAERGHELVRDYRTYLTQGSQDGQRRMIAERYGVDVESHEFGLVARHAREVLFTRSAEHGASADRAARALLLGRTEQPAVLLPSREDAARDEILRARVLAEVAAVTDDEVHGPGTTWSQNNYREIRQIVEDDRFDGVPAVYTFSDLSRRYPAEMDDIARATDDPDVILGQPNLSREGWKQVMRDQIESASRRSRRRIAKDPLSGRYVLGLLSHDSNRRVRALALQGIADRRKP